MILSIDTTTLHSVRVRIADGERRKRFRVSAYADTALRLISKKLRGKIPHSLGVTNGPGAFSATRIGVALANALAYAWQIPVVALTKDQFDSKTPLARGFKKSVPVIYSMPPNITTSKRK